MSSDATWGQQIPPDGPEAAALIDGEATGSRGKVPLLTQLGFCL